MEEAPDPNALMAYLMLAIYCLLMMFYWLGSNDDAEADEKTTKPEQVKMQGETFGAHLARVGLGLYAGFGIDHPTPAGKPASGFDDEDREAFLLGAQSAYETIVTAFATGHLESLDGLVADWVREGFGSAVAERRKRGERAKLEIVSIKVAEIERADSDAEQVEVTVRFVTEQVTALFDAEGAVVAGSPQAVVEVIDLWRFARRHDSTDPNWMLVATDGE